MNPLSTPGCLLAALLLSGSSWAQQPAPQARQAQQSAQAQQPKQVQQAQQAQQARQAPQQAQPSPAEQEAAAKKAAADAKAAKDKELLAASMDRLAERWRSQAPSKGWRIEPPPAQTGVPAAATLGEMPRGIVREAAEMGLVPPGVTPPGAGMPAAAPVHGAGAAATAPATGAAPRSPQALDAARVPIKSEKLGTAPPSADIKTRPTPTLPGGTNPAVQKEHSPPTANKQ